MQNNKNSFFFLQFWKTDEIFRFIWRNGGFSISISDEVAIRKYEKACCLSPLNHRRTLYLAGQLSGNFTLENFTETPWSSAVSVKIV
jgi:hypothetical protein